MLIKIRLFRKSHGAKNKKDVTGIDPASVGGRDLHAAMEIESYLEALLVWKS